MAITLKRVNALPNMTTPVPPPLSSATASISISLPPLTMRAMVRQRINFGVPHLLSAAAFSRATKALEVKHQGEPFGPMWSDILAQATASVFTAVAGLESYANELFADHRSIFPDVRPDLLKALWDVYEKRAMLDKFELALSLKQLPGLDRKAVFHKDADLLIRLRNSLVHFKPEWPDEEEKHAALASELAKRIKASPFTPTSPLFPMAWASHSCTAWAVSTVLAFIKSFEQAAKIPGRIDPFLPALADH